MKAYKVVVEEFQEESIDNYKHFIYKNPFNGSETLEEVMDILIQIAEINVLAVPETYAYSYAMARFGVNFFNRDIYIFYVYETQESWNYNIPTRIEWRAI